MGITVIIATCGRPDRLDAVLECLRKGKERHGHPVEVLVVDNHPDGAAEFVVRGQRSEDGGEASLPIRYLRSKPFNKACALNVGIAASTTEWLAFTDDDTLPEVDWLACGADYVGRSRCSVFGGRIVWGEDPPELPRWLRRGASGLFPGIGVHVGYDPQPQSGVLPKDMTAPFGANLFVRQDIFDQHGGYDETLWRLCERKWPVGCEDSEFGHRLHGRGEPIGYCREALVVHPVNAERASVRLHLWRAYCEGWRQPLIFTGDYLRCFEWYRVRILARHVAGSVMLGFRRDPAGAMYHLVEALRFLGMITGRWSRAYRERRREARLV